MMLKRHGASTPRSPRCGACDEEAVQSKVCYFVQLCVARPRIGSWWANSEREREKCDDQVGSETRLFVQVVVPTWCLLVVLVMQRRQTGNAWIGSTLPCSGWRLVRQYDD